MVSVVEHLYTVTDAEFTTGGTTNILVNKYMPSWGYPTSILSDDGLHFCSKLSVIILKRLCVRYIATSAKHPNGNDGVKRVNHTMVQMLGMVVGERQDYWDVYLPREECCIK